MKIENYIEHQREVLRETRKNRINQGIDDAIEAIDQILLNTVMINIDCADRQIRERNRVECEYLIKATVYLKHLKEEQSNVQ